MFLTTTKGEKMANNDFKKNALRIKELKTKKHLREAAQDDIFMMERYGKPLIYSRKVPCDFKNLDENSVCHVPSGLGGSFSLKFRFEFEGGLYFQVANGDFEELFYVVHGVQK